VRGDDNSNNNNPREVSSNSGSSGGSEIQATPVPDEPRTDVTEVRDAATNAPLAFFLDDRATTLRESARTRCSGHGH
jgi:hypothetical protein